MTDRVEPSPGTTVSSYELSGAIRYASITRGWIVPSGEDYYASIAGLSGTPLSGFTVSSSSSSLTVTIDTGEAFIDGKWCARDTTTSVSLASGTDNQTVYAGWPAASGDTMIVGLDTAFPPEHGRVPIWTFDTDGSGVTREVNERDTDPNLSAINTQYDTDRSGVVDNSENLQGVGPDQFLRSDQPDTMRAPAYFENETIIRDRLYVDNHGFGGTPNIALPIGDTDTGLHTNTDGVLQLYSDSEGVVTINSGFEGGMRIRGKTPLKSESERDVFVSDGEPSDWTDGDIWMEPQS